MIMLGTLIRNKTYLTTLLEIKKEIIESNGYWNIFKIKGFQTECHYTTTAGFMWQKGDRIALRKYDFVRHEWLMLEEYYLRTRKKRNCFCKQEPSIMRLQLVCAILFPRKERWKKKKLQDLFRSGTIGDCMIVGCMSVIEMKDCLFVRMKNPYLTWI